MVVGFTLIFGELFSAVCETIHAQSPVKSHLVDTVLPFNLAVMTWRGDADTLILNAHILKRMLKQGLML